MLDQLPELLKKLNDPDPHVREWALDEIGTLKPAHALHIIRPFLSDESAQVRETAACNLGEIQNEQAIPDLIKSAREDREEKVRFYALNALSAYASLDILDFLVHEVYQGELSIMAKQTVAEQLGHYESQKAIDALVVLLQDDDPYVLAPTADALLKLNWPQLRPIWQNMVLNYDHAHLAHVALQALAELEEVEAFDIALSFAASKEAEVREGGAHALASLDDENVIPHLIELARHDLASGVRDMAILGLTEYTSPQIHRYFIEAIYNQEISTFAKELIAEELSLYESDASVNALSILLEDENEAVRTTAKDSLHHFNGRIGESSWESAINGHGSVEAEENKQVPVHVNGSHENSFSFKTMIREASMIG